MNFMYNVICFFCVSGWFFSIFLSLISQEMMMNLCSNSISEILLRLQRVLFCSYLGIFIGGKFFCSVNNLYKYTTRKCKGTWKRKQVAKSGLVREMIINQRGLFSGLTRLSRMTGISSDLHAINNFVSSKIVDTWGSCGMREISKRKHV